MKKILFSLALLLIAFPLIAQDAPRSVLKASPIARVGHYLNTHKRLLISDAIVVASFSADAASSVHCQHSSPACLEQNSIVGPRPNEVQTWGWSTLAMVSVVGGDHLLWWAANKEDQPVRNIIWIPTIAIGISECFNIRNNVNTAEFLEPHGVGGKGCSTPPCPAGIAFARARLAQP